MWGAGYLAEFRTEVEVSACHMTLACPLLGRGGMHIWGLSSAPRNRHGSCPSSPKCPPPGASSLKGSADEMRS